VIPWGERSIVGTTDTDYDGPVASPTCDPEDVAYVLGVVNDAFPEIHLQPSDVRSTWVGLRPLVADANGDPSDISRRHEISMGEPGWWDVTGGKLTTYRLMAEELVDAVAGYLGDSLARCRTATTPLLEPDEAVHSGMLPPAVSREAVRHYCQDEWAVHLDDVVVRRTSWIHYADNRNSVIAQVAEWMAAELGWSQQRLRDELSAYPELNNDAGEIPVPHFTSRGAMAHSVDN
jgi:glycerol-3-phosphate dehydrogenase